ncbi:biotin--[acetyl-CoA-carboxylase] ligase [Amaricoccus solimangrovi]|uniref:biotin--[biotin carboxyl-carrier protein] ligase n=1 Tax=Amaricoccus solimangrovi TaxID=2589815 RepID=A0A501WZP4_9RHOB|nr:biotin--[acetyl-CoA-carboxylase] ligase [Amaricoccus solimangrovi]TPE53885.1 biotin--[acetyl-CoA-carboxylase] ligase [Amaricoccus solimangrovi]
MTRWPEGVGREILAEIDSTNAEALRRGRAGRPDPAWILSRNQTAGRGRRGRVWQQDPGNFAASLFMLVEGGPTAAAQRSFVAALALFDALVAVTGRPELFALKWPNDVLLTGGKLAGILLESEMAPRGGVALAVGIGVNLRSAPEARALGPGATRPVSLGESLGGAPTPEEFLDLLAPAFAHWDARLRGEGFAPLRAAWLARAARIGEPIVARLPGRELSGLFETIDADGALVLAAAEGRITLPAADVFFLPV